MSAMRRYGRDEYEDLDEYETDGEEQEYEEDDGGGYEEEEVHQPTQEELDYLALRQRLKESIRKQMKKELGTATNGSRDKLNSVRKDNYGSFFGPSRPVIAQRVIQESKSLLENPNLAARISKPHNTNNKNPVSSSVAAKPRPNLPKAISGVKKKVEILKSNRNYSFLLSDDAEVPAPLKNPPSRNMSTPKSELRPAPIQSRSKQVVNERGRDVSNGRDGRKHVLASSQSRPKPGFEKTMTAPPSKSSTESRKQFGSCSATGPGRPVGPKGVPSNRPVAAPGNRVGQSVSKNLTAGARKPTSSQHPVVRKPSPSHLQSGVQRPTQSHPHSSSLLRNTSVQRNMHQLTSRPKVTPRQSLPSRDEVKRPPPKVMTRGVSGDQRRVLGDQRPKAKPGKRPFESDDEDDPIKMIQNMFGRHSRVNFRDDDDDSDMEANFDEIQMEEDRSSRIAKKEDDEQARLLEEEEKRRKMRLAKKRKMGH